MMNINASDWPGLLLSCFFVSFRFRQLRCTNLQKFALLLRGTRARKTAETQIRIRRRVYLWCKCHCFSGPQRPADYARPTLQKFSSGSCLAPRLPPSPPLFDRRKSVVIQGTRLFIVQQWGLVQKVKTMTTDPGQSRHTRQGLLSTRSHRVDYDWLFMPSFRRRRGFEKTLRRVTTISGEQYTFKRRKRMRYFKESTMRIGCIEIIWMFNCCIPWRIVTFIQIFIKWLHMYFSFC